MKKIATVLILCFLFIGSNRVYAQELTPADITPTVSRESVFDYYALKTEQVVLKYFEETGEKFTWAICSMNKHKNIRPYLFCNEDGNQESEQYNNFINTINEECDFVQIGKLLDISLLETTKKAFEEDYVKASVNALIPISLEVNRNKLCEEIKSHNLPIYWDIKENHPDAFTLEVAIGKYVIQPGDTLSQIAELHQTTIEKLLEDNHNITNPDLILAGDFLVIK